MFDEFFEQYLKFIVSSKEEDKNQLEFFYLVSPPLRHIVDYYMSMLHCNNSFNISEKLLFWKMFEIILMLIKQIENKNE